MHSSIQVANKLLEIARSKDLTLTPMQLIKLVYLCHGWMLGLHGRPLLKESVEAWRYGPVVRNLYSNVKKFRDQPVDEILAANFWRSNKDSEFDTDEADVIEQVFDLYGNMSGITLSNLTHQKNSPWEITCSLAGQNKVIPNDLIEEHYKGLYQQYSQD